MDWPAPHDIARSLTAAVQPRGEAVLSPFGGVLLTLHGREDTAFALTGIHSIHRKVYADYLERQIGVADQIAHSRNSFLRDVGLRSRSTLLCFADWVRAVSTTELLVFAFEEIPQPGRAIDLFRLCSRHLVGVAECPHVSQILMDLDVRHSNSLALMPPDELLSDVYLLRGGEATRSITE